MGTITVPSAKQGVECGCLLLPLGPSLPPAQLQGLSPVPGTPGFLPRLGDVAAIFPIAGPAGSKAGHLPQVHKDTHGCTGHWHSQSHRLPSQRLPPAALPHQAPIHTDIASQAPLPRPRTPCLPYRLPPSQLVWLEACWGVHTHTLNAPGWGRCRCSAPSSWPQAQGSAVLHPPSLGPPVHVLAAAKANLPQNGLVVW